MGVLQQQKKRRLEDDGNDILFKLIFNNIVLFKNIFEHVRLYKKNECVVFNNRNDLLNYQERSYIHRIDYEGNERLKVGDLPSNGVLKEVKITRRDLSDIGANIIPYGVEVLDYKRNYNGLVTPLSVLPSTIHTVYNVAPIFNDDFYEIPPNITSISFFRCPNISGSYENGNGFITIPNTIRSLYLDCEYWNNDRIPLNKGDIPEGVTNLSMPDYDIKKNLFKDILPSTIKHLELSGNNEDDEDEEYSVGLFDFMPPNVETFLFHSYCDIKVESNLTNCTSIKKLAIYIYNDTKINPNSLPPSITNLTIKILPPNNVISNLIEINSIPNSVTNLKLLSHSKMYSTIVSISKDLIPNSVVSLTLNKTIVNQQDILQLPTSITNLELVSSCNSKITCDSLIKMLSIMTPSITSISIPILYKNNNSIIFPSTIKNINYNNITDDIF